MSDRSLTGYDTHDALTGRPIRQVYSYDVNAAGGQGEVVCVSCNPTGARPEGEDRDTLNNGLGGVSGRAGQGIAANVPGWTPYSSGFALYQSRYLTSEGRVFFDSSDALVAQDINNARDVYEYEPAGVGGCTEASATFHTSSGGCVDLVSSGTGVGESAFLDASQTGDDGFPHRRPARADRSRLGP